jgi:hypothetical protein
MRLHDIEYRAPVAAGSIDIALFGLEKAYEELEVLRAHALVGFQQHVEILIGAVVGPNPQETPDVVLGPDLVEYFFLVFSHNAAPFTPAF